eukprot:Blabericola_migrator_1__2321@NODE_1649_length_4098_cov_131_273877_g1073_i0_p3_GENE_NODE_1649_length_4098_cov_131_273877_g1073_i0NODE_1649_length_4098_cov_131_273877_g1073_i0_p3_ORF_typecomplete_len126_score15_83_NODE_1649_length_4098_cov_131_273877_g1073_i0426803
MGNGQDSQEEGKEERYFRPSAPSRRSGVLGDQQQRLVSVEKVKLLCSKRDTLVPDPACKSCQGGEAPIFALQNETKLQHGNFSKIQELENIKTDKTCAWDILPMHWLICTSRRKRPKMQHLQPVI